MGWPTVRFPRTQGRVSFISCPLMVELPARGSLNDSLPSAKEDVEWSGVRVVVGGLGTRSEEPSKKP